MVGSVVPAPPVDVHGFEFDLTHDDRHDARDATFNESLLGPSLCDLYSWCVIVRHSVISSLGRRERPVASVIAKPPARNRRTPDQNHAWVMAGEPTEPVGGADE